ncbi:glycosyltransferase [Alkalihalobacillus sp. MEB130]|uniref:glycosyltransferase family 2 protein n=1 Tax=Alkalihalobacillus sp. MEB130 TaxID=2976704 RepID=UPI0028E00005|nr:glycosyltransferase [Alkalihalobacillus sp. MEB130]MDT8859862.1 glycosyltransferase [Alkalihalobacillus sp. MEB130]
MNVFEIFGWGIFIYMVGASIFYLILFGLSAVVLWRERGLNKKGAYEDLLASKDTKPISILVPAYNEEAGVVSSVRSLLSMNYPEYEIIVINDGSTDQTLTKMISAYKMKPVSLTVRKQVPSNEIRAVYRSTIFDHLLVVDKVNGGKADALNAGINTSKFPYVCSLDGDSLLEQDALIKVMKPIIDSNEQVIATGGSIRIANGCQIERGEVVKVGLPSNPIVIMQIIEYLRAFLIGRIGLSRHNLLLIISGAFGVFNKAWVIKAGGYERDTVGEDMELVVRLHKVLAEEKSNKQIRYIPDPVCWTEAPDSLSILRRQRTRWQRGLFETLRTHRKMLLNSRYKKIGFISMPYFVIIELLGAIIEGLAYVYIISGLLFSFIPLELSLMLLLITWFYGSYISMCGVLLEEWSLKRYPKKRHLLTLFFYASTEMFWYRPLNVWWRIQGIWQAFRKRSDWGVMTRKGISKDD